MLTTLMISLLFFAVGTVVLTSGVFTLQSNLKASVNRAFFALTATITIWSCGMALAFISSDIARCEIFWRISSIGWSTVYALLLHFILIITGRFSSFNKRLLYLFIYLPAFLTLFAFAVPNRLNPSPYNFHMTRYGWINVANNNIWDWMFYIYYIGFTLMGLWLLYQWGKKSQNPVIKKKSRIMFLSIIIALILGTITDVVLNNLLSELPQMAPIILLIPTLAIFHVLQKDSFSITEGIDKKTSYIALYISVLIYIILSAFQVLISNDSSPIDFIVRDKTIIRAIIVQIQMFLSIYLVLKENQPGYISAVIMNSMSLVSAVAFLFRYKSSTSLPALMSYIGILVVITLIKAYKDKNTAYIKRINTHAFREKFYTSVFNQAPVGIAIFSEDEFSKDEEFNDLNINPSYERILGRSKKELQRINWLEITHPDDLDADLEYFERFKKGEIDLYSREKRYVRPDGSIVWVDMLISRFASLSQNPGDHVCIITDITERKKIEETLKYNSEHDMLTGLYNRFVLEKLLGKDSLFPNLDKRALIGINLSDMHVLNLRYGYHFSQGLLKNIADSLKVFCNDNYSLFYIFEYGFAFYIKSYGNETNLTAFCNEVSEILKSYLFIHGIGVGIGILQIDDPIIQRDSNELLQMLMNTSEVAAKGAENNVNILFHSEELDIQITRESEISQEITEIAEGIKMERLYLHYQPIYDITTDSICGFEALARLNSDKYGRISPMEFIPIAEKTSMISPLGEYIIFQALQFLQKLKENGYDTISVSINISTIQILEEGFADKFLNMIKDMHINPSNVGIELTESVFATERAEINAVINTLKAAGVKVLIDDFGTGYSSLAREQELNVDCLKIDKSFIDKLIVLKPEESITIDIISMSHKLGHCVIAEGVEYEQQLNYLREHGCDRIQGYLISKPVDEDSALAFLEKSSSQSSIRPNISPDPQ